MDFRRQALLIIIALTSVFGCRQNQAANRELLERELRLQEDRIYQLEGALEDAQRELLRARGIDPDTCLPENKPGLTNTFSNGPTGGSPPNSTFAPPSFNAPPTNPGSTSSPSVILPPTGDIAPPAVQLPNGSGPAPPFRGAPIISPPDPNKPEGIPTPGGSAPPFKPSGAQHGGFDGGSYARSEPVMKEMSSPKFVSPYATGTGSTGGGSVGGGSAGYGSSGNNGIADGTEGEALPTPLPADMQVKTISLNRRTGGWNSDGKPGDDGITVVIEPRNVRGEVVPTPGSVSLVLIDPAAEGEAGRFARWDFSAADAGALFRPLATGGSGGLHFELPWPDAPPTHSKLKLFIRFNTDDGRRLQAEKDLFVDLGTGGTTSWRDPRAQPIQTASRAVGGATTAAADKAVAEASNVQPATLHWSSPKPSASTPTPEAQGPDMLPTTTNALPLSGANTGPTLGPALVAPGN